MIMYKVMRVGRLDIIIGRPIPTIRPLVFWPFATSALVFARSVSALSHEAL